jgi:hypothetical protein
VPCKLNAGVDNNWAKAHIHIQKLGAISAEPPLYCSGFCTSSPRRATLLLFAEGRTLTLEEFKYAVESWGQTPAIAGGAFLQLFHCHA